MSRRAFSLFEVLVAIALIMALLSTMFGVLWQVVNTRDRVSERAQQLEATTRLLDRLDRALMTCLVEGPNGEAGVSGDATSISVLAQGVVVDLDATDAWSRDRQRHVFTYDEASRQLSMSRTVLPSMQAAESASFGVTFGKIRFRYHDGSDWRDSFDTLEAGRLPAAVEVAVWYLPWPGEIVDDEPIGDLFDARDDELPERLTFDTDVGFDEDAYLEEMDVFLVETPVPDRIRVLTVPDADPDDGPAEDLDRDVAAGGDA